MKESLRTMPSHATFEADNPKKQQAYFTAQTERPQVPQQEYIPLKAGLGIMDGLPFQTQTSSRTEAVVPSPPPL